MTANEWTQIVHVMKLKWPNFNWTDETIKNVYNDLKGIDARYIEKSIEQSFRSGANFPPNPSQIFSSAMEIQRYDLSVEDQPRLELTSCSLRDYLSSQGWESVAGGMYHFGRQRYLNKKQLACEEFEYDLEWNNGGKEKYINEFGIANNSLTKVMERVGEEESNGVS